MQASHYKELRQQGRARLRLESTSLRIRDAERAKESEERLAQNKAALPTKFYEVRAGRDNRWP